MNTMSRKLFLMVSICMGLFILGLLSGVFAAILEDSDYDESSQNGLVKYWSTTALNSITNSFGGQLGNCSATTYHWGKMENVSYPLQGTLDVRFSLWAGSLWDHYPAWPIDYGSCDPGLSPEGIRDQKIGPVLPKGGGTFTWSLYLTNTRNFGANTGTHYFRAFTTIMDSTGHVDLQLKTTVGPYGLPTN